AQKTCPLNRNAIGLCKPYADCNVLKGQIIFPDEICESGTICCPDNAVVPTLPTPYLITLPIVLTELTTKPAITMPTVPHVPPPALTTILPTFDIVDEPTFTDEFYRRLVLTFGKKYSIYKQTSNTSTTDQQSGYTTVDPSTSKAATIALTETFPTTEDPSKLLNKLHLL
ncbi:PREDICTED: uncharacterized protein LOC108357485, partial [Rhagoletis zephyria]|uniref:uncharacterized protein LOC108357485 n=1 Tax=Rhagoletis zephyria TaxID=28612 RepID=UPI0008112306